MKDGTQRKERFRLAHWDGALQLILRSDSRLQAVEVWVQVWRADSRASAKALGGHMFDMNKRRPEWLEPRGEVYLR